MQARRQVHQDYGAADAGDFRAFLKECEIIMAANEENRPKKPIYELRKIKRILDSEK